MSEPIEEIKQALAAATPGPWEVKHGDQGECHVYYGMNEVAWDVSHKGNANLIAKAPEYIEFLVETLELVLLDRDTAKLNSKQWEKAFDNTDRQYLMMEHKAAELQRQLISKTEELAEQEAEIQQLRKALKFYSVNSHYECSHTYDETGEAEVVPSKVGRDRGSLARKALGE
ncbi:hypothetical protein [Paenibacillus medicaginis]|uniref:Ead/Ea22-like family protein n=1 Tax=Paenibacillus medicaginis TaxID=1470560 RepID=A0ABV5C0S1_9BACL